ncbi:hypothetical protein PR202_ga18208 [Eleusine coracana subsp. coracana]|uniref:Uncharacterized protein n=1 Tax=Eleusine coracana subsp. coracana TaxID=191504 RepID=A0AAV5CS62_ELECO|nr:hypothetical protein PR202_ga18208 [Eleusine coracana subsp. coracana]
MNHIRHAPEPAGLPLVHRSFVVPRLTSAAYKFTGGRSGPCCRNKVSNCSDHRLLDPTLAGMACFIAADEEENMSPARENSSENTPEHLKNASFFQGRGTGRRPYSSYPAVFRL